MDSMNWSSFNLAKGNSISRLKEAQFKLN